MPQLALAVVGAEVGAAVLGTGVVAFGLTGGAIGMTAGSLLGGLLFAPTAKSQGPRLADLKAPAVAYGSVIPYVEGHPRLAGVIVWASEKREIPNTTSSGGKGGGGSETTTFTYEQDLMFMVGDRYRGALLRRVWFNGDLVWTRADDGVADSVEVDSELWTRITFYDGRSDQDPDPTYEAAVGSDLAPAYRARETVFIEGLQLGSSGNLPVITFETTPAEGGEPTYTGPDFIMDFGDGLADDSAPDPCPPGSTGAGLITHSSGGWDGGPYVQITSALDSYAQCSGSKLGGFDDLIIARWKARWRTLANITNHGLFSIQFAGGGSENIGFYSTAGRLGWTHSPGDVAPVVTTDPVCPSANVWYDFELRMDYTGNSTLSVNDAVVLTRSIAGGGPKSSSNIFTGLTTSNAVDYDVDYITMRFTEDPTTTGDTPLAEPTLQEVVEYQCQLGGLSLEYVDASELVTRNVHALVSTQITSPRQIIEVLGAGYHFVAVESEVVRFKFRGDAAVDTIPYDDLAPMGDGDPLPISKANDLEIAVQVFVKYSNLYDDYQDGTEASDRLISSGQNTTLVEMPLGFKPTVAKRIADAHVLDGAASVLRFGPFNLTRDYAHLEPTDCVNVFDSRGNTFRVRITKKTEARGLITLEAVLDDASVFSSEAVTSSSGYTYSTGIRLPVDTEAELLDIPLLRDEDEGAGFYAVAAPADDVTWPGAVLFKSTDDATFTNSTTLDAQGIFGTATTTLGSGETAVFDEKNSLTVEVNGELASTTRDILLSTTANAILVGSEVIQFRTATLVSAGVYTLSGLLRGRRGTEWAVATHASSERVVLLDTALRRVTMNNAEIGVERFWKAVTIGRSASTADSESFTDNAVGLKPFAPVDVRFARDASSNLTITLKRRTRKSTRFGGTSGISVPLGEESESYSLDVYTTSGYATVVRTLTSTNGSFSYTAAQQTTDFGSAQATLYVKAYQLSAAVGRGYPATAQG